MEDNLENEYIVTDENGCATDPTIFGEWDYNADTNTLMANFNAFKFPSSDNIRFQCNIRVCFGKCQPVNCRGFNAYGRRKRREITDESQIPNKSVATRSINDDLGLEGSLREEITISSNAILTFEKRDGRYSNSDNRKLRQFQLLKILHKKFHEILSITRSDCSDDFKFEREKLFKTFFLLSQ